MFKRKRLLEFLISGLAIFLVFISIHNLEVAEFEKQPDSGMRSVAIELPIDNLISLRITNLAETWALIQKIPEIQKMLTSYSIPVELPEVLNNFTWSVGLNEQLDYQFHIWDENERGIKLLPTTYWHYNPEILLSLEWFERNLAENPTAAVPPTELPNHLISGQIDVEALRGLFKLVLKNLALDYKSKIEQTCQSRRNFLFRKLVNQDRLPQAGQLLDVNNAALVGYACPVNGNYHVRSNSIICDHQLPEIAMLESEIVKVLENDLDFENRSLLKLFDILDRRTEKYLPLQFYLDFSQGLFSLDLSLDSSSSGDEDDDFQLKHNFPASRIIDWRDMSDYPPLPAEIGFHLFLALQWRQIFQFVPWVFPHLTAEGFRQQLDTDPSLLELIDLLDRYQSSLVLMLQPEQISLDGMDDSKLFTLPAAVGFTLIDRADRADRADRDSGHLEFIEKLFNYFQFLLLENDEQKNRCYYWEDIEGRMVHYFPLKLFSYQRGQKIITRIYYLNYQGVTMFSFNREIIASLIRSMNGLGETYDLFSVNRTNQRRFRFRAALRRDVIENWLDYLAMKMTFDQQKSICSRNRRDVLTQSGFNESKPISELPTEIQKSCPAGAEILLRNGRTFCPVHDQFEATLKLINRRNPDYQKWLTLELMRQQKTSSLRIQGRWAE